MAYLLRSVYRAMATKYCMSSPHRATADISTVQSRRILSRHRAFAVACTPLQLKWRSTRILVSRNTRSPFRAIAVKRTQKKLRMLYRTRVTVRTCTQRQKSVHRVRLLNLRTN